MASNNRQAEETRIRRILEITSFELSFLEHRLKEQGYIPDSSDEQAASDAAFRFRKDFNPGKLFIPASLRSLFKASGDAFNLVSDAIVKEAESVKYDAVKDFIHMLAVRKAQTSVTQQQQGSRDSDVTIKEEDA